VAGGFFDEEIPVGAGAAGLVGEEDDFGGVALGGDAGEAFDGERDDGIDGVDAGIGGGVFDGEGEAEFAFDGAGEAQGGKEEGNESRAAMGSRIRRSFREMEGGYCRDRAAKVNFSKV